METEAKKYESVEDVLAVMQTVNGHFFKEYDINHRLDNPNNKGALGQIVEEGILGYRINSSPYADIRNLNLEIKVTGVVKAKKKTDIRAKERLTLETINYSKVVNTTFEESDLWKKCQLMLLVFYQYLNDTSYGDMPIIDSAINEFDEVDLQIIKNDYETIVNKIKEGKAEEISEGDTMYLGACTAGTGALQKQPFSDVRAKQRKFCIKTSYFTELVRKYINHEDLEKINAPIETVKNNSFELAMETMLHKYYGWSEQKIRDHFSLDVSKTAKNRYERYVAAMLGVKGDISATEQFVKSDTELKTVRIQKNGRIEQSMSFPYFDFRDIVEQDWNNSDLRNLFETKRFMLAVFKESDEGEMVFDSIKFWNMDSKTIDKKVKPVFDELKKVLSNGEIVSEIKTNSSGKEIWYNNFPGMADNDIVHVRPHGRNKKDTCPLPVADKLTGIKTYTKQCFWIKNSYVKDVILKS